MRHIAPRPTRGLVFRDQEGGRRGGERRGEEGKGGERRGEEGRGGERKGEEGRGGERRGEEGRGGERRGRGRKRDRESVEGEGEYLL